MDFTKLLDIRYPIIQAPMAGSDNATLVAACSNAGILGSLGAQYKTPTEIESAIREIRSLTDRPFALNLFALGSITLPEEDLISSARSQLQLYYNKYGIEAPSIETVTRQISADEQLQVILDARVPILSFTLGVLERKWIEAFKQIGSVVIGTATNVQEAIALQEAEVDAICVQGAEAGGHRGTFLGSYENSMIGLISLIPQVVDALSVPVIAAGGIMDGRGIAAALSLGAAGVQMGTAFLTVTESPIHKKYKAAIRQSDADRTAITRVFSGGAARGIVNQFMQENSNAEILPFPFHNALTRSIRKAANERGDIENTNLWCGQSGRLARELDVRDLVITLVNETREALASSNKQLIAQN